MKISEILTGAADLIERRGWNQGDYANKRGGLCVVAAIGEATQSAKWRTIERAIEALKDHLGVKHAASWNDAPGRTKEEVIDALRAAAAAHAAREVRA